jgi:hypothetical protein
LGYEESGNHHQGHEIAAAVERATPSNEHRQIACEQKTDVEQMATLHKQAHQCQEPGKQQYSEHAWSEQLV